MKIRAYLAIVILVCLAGGYLIEVVLSNQYHKVHAAASRHNQSLLWQKDLERLVADVAQYLISVDLILGSNETYLVRGALSKGRIIVDSLNGLATQPPPVALAGELSAAIAATTSINRLLQQAAVIDANRSDVLSTMLDQSDAVSERLVNDLYRLRAATDVAVAAQKAQLNSEQERSSLVQTLCFVLFSLVVLVLWYWTNRQISNPLRELTKMASASESGAVFGGVNRGPTEILELSENTKRLTDSLSYQATHDALTELYNRRQFERVLDRHICATDGERDKSTHVLCFLDLDHFKIVNDTCGHAAGDELLSQVARLIQSSVRGADTTARLGGDEFAILLTACDLAQALEICNKIRNNIMEVRYQWAGEVYRISASIGIAEISGNDAAMEDVLNAADTACKVAKESGRDRVHVFEVGDEVLARKRFEMLCVNQINNAIDEDRFELHRQFIMPLQQDAHSGSHFEILVRLRAQDGRTIFPNDFLPVAERYNLGARLDRWIINATLDWLGAHPLELENLQTCAINLSGQSVASKDLHEFIVDKLQQSGFPAHKLCFEITETAAITNIDMAREFIATLKTLGCRFALDDFGSGMSSFAYLKSLDVDIIKIDGVFVKDMTEDAVNYATVKSINDVAKATGKLTVAEFVENAGIATALTEIGVDYGQGYHFSKPEPLENSVRLVRNSQGLA